MTIITVTGNASIEDIKDIVRERLDENDNDMVTTIYIEHSSYQALLAHDEVKRGLVFMNPEDLMEGRLTIYGATIRAYFPEILPDAA